MLPSAGRIPSCSCNQGRNQFWPLWWCVDNSGYDENHGSSKLPRLKSSHHLKTIIVMNKCVCISQSRALPLNTLLRVLLCPFLLLPNGQWFSPCAAKINKNNTKKKKNILWGKHCSHLCRLLLQIITLLDVEILTVLQSTFISKIFFFTSQLSQVNFKVITQIFHEIFCFLTNLMMRIMHTIEKKSKIMTLTGQVRK